MLNPIKQALGGLTLAASLALPGIALAPVPAAAQVSAADDLVAVNRAIRSITTLKANFSQTAPNGDVQNGTLLLKQPGKLRFDYGKAVNMLIVADGRSLYIIDYDVSQVQRLPIRNTPIGALLDPARDLSKLGKLVETGDPRIVSIEVRDAAHPEYGIITLVFTRKPSAPGGLELYGWVAKDAQGNRTTIRLTNLVYGAAIDDSAFRWRDPRPRSFGPR